MPWLSPDRFVDACGPLAASLRREWEPRGGEDALAEALADDPRRCVALVGDPGVDTSRLALELARGAGRALYPDPVAAPAVGADVAHLGALLEGTPEGEPALVVLDGPDPREALASLAELLARPIHPRLKVLIPCTPALARRLSRLGGGYPQGSILVATLGGEPAAPAALPGDLDAPALLRLLLAGRLGPDATPDLADEWIDRGLAARTPGGGLVSLVPERTREAWLSAGLLTHDAGPTRLDAALNAAPAIRPRAFETLLHLTAGEPPAALVAIAAHLEPEGFPDPRSLFERGIPLAPPVATTLARRAEAMLGRDLPATERSAVAASLAGLRRLAGDRDGEAEALQLAIDSATGTPSIRLRVELAGTRRDLDLAREAAEAARRSDDDDTLAVALRQLVTLLHANGDVDAALERCGEWIAVEERTGRAAAAAAARARAARLAQEADEPDRALSLLREGSSDRRSVGDVRGLCATLYRTAGLLVDLRRLDEASEIIHEALALDERVDEPTGVGYCRWMLGAMADKRGDAAEAATQYDASVRAYSRAGRVPDRLMASLVRARAHASSSAQVEEETGEGVAVPEAPDAGEERLVELRVKPES